MLGPSISRPMLRTERELGWCLTRIRERGTERSQSAAAKNDKVGSRTTSEREAASTYAAAAICTRAGR